MAFLCALLGLTLAAVAIQSLLSRRRSRVLRRLADEMGMRYSPRDAFGLSTRVQRAFPVPGVSDVVVSDLIYRTEQDRYRYIFTAEYTRGVLGAKKRVRRAGAFSETLETSARQPVALPMQVGLAKEGSLIDQYRSLLSPF